MPVVNLEKKYKEEVAPKLKEIFKLPSVLAVPKADKVVINAGIGKFKGDEKNFSEIASVFALIAGQKPVFTKARRSIAGFKIRQGEVVGLKVTLRGKRMYDFLGKLINLTLPRVRDFRGISERSIDRAGNLTLGFKECSVFPEVNLDSLKINFSLEVVIGLKGVKKREEAVEFYRQLGLPLEKSQSAISKKHG